MLVGCDPKQVLPSGQSLALLDGYLAATIDLHRQVKHALWNLEDPGASALSKPLDNVATSLDYCCDLIVAHAALRGGVVNGTVQVVAARSFLSRYPLDRADALAHAGAVIAAMETLAGAVRTAATRAAGWHDPDTAAVLIEIARCIERHVWLVGSAAATVQARVPRSGSMAPVPAEGGGTVHPANRRSDRRSESPAAAYGHDRGAAREVRP